MVGHKNKIFFVIITLLQGASLLAMQRTFDAQNNVESLVYAKGTSGHATYNNYSTDELKALLSFVWRTLDPGQGAQLHALALRLNIPFYNAWEYLNSIRNELLAEIERRNIFSAMQPIPISSASQSRVSQTVPAISTRQVYLIDTNAVPNLIIGKVQMNPRTTVIQLRSVDQTKPNMSDVFGGETCPILALHNAMNILGYAYTGDLNMLRNINNEAVVKQFLMKLGSRKCEWNRLTTQEIEKLFAAGIPANLSKNIQVVDSVIELENPRAGEEIYGKTSTILKSIRAGLREDNFAYSLVLGDGEYIQLHLKPGITMHYISFSIIKRGNQIQYIIADSLGNKSHLDGMRWVQLNYLMYLIDNGFLESSLSGYMEYLRTTAQQEKEREEEEYEQQLRNIYGVQDQP